MTATVPFGQLFTLSPNSGGVKVSGLDQVVGLVGESLHLLLVEC